MYDNIPADRGTMWLQNRPKRNEINYEKRVAGRRYGSKRET